MLPKVIMHNEISVDGSVKGFNVDFGAYYRLAIGYKPDVVLVGSITAKSAINKLYPEKKTDFRKPKTSKDDKRPCWVIPDSRGILKGFLHLFRRFDYSKDVIILASERTPSSYLKYLEEREYDYITAGKEHIDYRKALEILSERYKVKTVLTDSGGILNSILIEQGLVSEISIIISPVLVGMRGVKLFRSLGLPSILKLKLIQNKVLDDNYMLLVYKVLK
jgi:2,5-diamino-6-(ribosylamino)-4(3H)-pyrimidinone 5'-phosphate reductase